MPHLELLKDHIDITRLPFSDQAIRASRQKQVWNGEIQGGERGLVEVSGS